MSAIITGSCPKCGGEKILVRFQARRESWERMGDDKDWTEHLRLRCENCLYAWNIDCLDAHPSEPPSVVENET